MTDGFFGRAEPWARRHPLRVGEVRISVLGVRIIRSFLDVRVMGVAAEMTYYALLSVFPLIGAMLATLALAERYGAPHRRGGERGVEPGDARSAAPAGVSVASSRRLLRASIHR